MSSTEQQIDDAVAKRHVQNTDTSLGVQSADLDMNLHKIIALEDPTGDKDAANKEYVDVHGSGGYTNLTQFVSQGNWRIFYSNGVGDVTELALGTNGQYLKSNGVVAIPSWSVPAGGGDVLGPATNTDGYIPLWSGANSKTLANGIANGSANWNTAFGWGDHAIAGYLLTLAGHNVTELDDVTSAGSGIIITVAERTKLNGIEEGATTDQTGADIVALINAGADLIDDDNIAASIARDTEVDAKVSDDVYGVGWNGVTTIAPSKNAVYDKIEIIDGGYTNLTEFIGQTNWRIFYSNGTGDVTELALGTNGQYLKSNGISSIPSWAAPAGSSLWTDESASSYYRPNNVTDSGNTGYRIYDAGYTKLGQVTPTTGNNFGGGSCVDGTVLRINDGNVGSSTTNGTVPLWVKRYTNRNGTDWGCGAAYFGAVKTGGTNPLHTVVVDTYCQGGSIPAAGGVLGSMLIHLKNDTCTAANQDIHNIQMITYTPSSNYQGQHCCFTNDVCNRHSDRGWLTRYAAGWTNAFNSSNESTSNYNNSCAYSTGSGTGGGKWYIGYECNSIAYDAGCGKGEGIYFQTSTFDANAVCMRAEGTMTFKDSVTGEKTLAQLAAGGSGLWTDSGQYIRPASASGYRILDAGTNLNTVTFSANTVFILAPGATYDINSSLIISNTHVSIIGDGATIRKTAQADGLRITGNYCSVQGVEIDGNSQGWAGVFVTGSHNIIDGVIAHNNGGLGIGQDGQSTTCQYNRIVNCESFLNGEIGFSLNDVDFAVVSNNASHDNTLEGFTCDSNSPGWASGCVFDGNVGYNNPGGVGGFGIDRARNCVFSNNMIDSSGANDGMKTQNNQGPVEYCIFSGNTLVNNGGYGINITSGTAGTSHHNKLVGNVYHSNASGDYHVVAGQNNVIVENSLNNVVEDTSPELGGDLYCRAYQLNLDNNKAITMNNTSGAWRVGLRLNTSNDWEVGLDGHMLVLGYGCSDNNPVMIRINGTNNQQLIRSPDTDSAGKHYVTIN